MGAACAFRRRVKLGGFRLRYIQRMSTRTDDPNLLDRVLSARSSMLRLLAVAVLLALGVSLVSAGIASYVEPIALMVGGGALIVTVLLATAFVQLRNLSDQITIQPSVLLHENMPVGISNYRFSEELARVFRGGLAERDSVPDSNQSS